jgi:cation diffusion facilitator family transporter
MRTILASVAGTTALTITKLVAAGFSGSAAMLAEGIHSLVDMGNSVLVYVGLRRSAKPSDEMHPFGYGRELYFWTLIVALFIFIIGGGVTITEGVARVLKPSTLEYLGWSYTVLALSAVFNGFTWGVALREFLAEKGEITLWQALRQAKDPTILIVLFEDTASLVGLVIAFLGLYLAQRFDAPVLDGLASILIGLLLGGVAAGLVYQCKTLLVGESAKSDVVRSIRDLVTGDEAVEQIEDLLTMHLSPEDILLNLKVRFRGGLSTAAIGEAVDRLEQLLRDKHPEIQRIFIEPGPVEEAGKESLTSSVGPN